MSEYIFNPKPGAKKMLIHNPSEKKEVQNQQVDKPVMVKDPVCGMTIRPEKAAGHSEFEGQTWHFCSNGCKTKFDAAPRMFIGSKTSTSKPLVAEKPNHAEIKNWKSHTSNRDQSTNKHQMRNRDQNLENGPSDPVLYTCPMHPEIKQDKPGSCPICGMALEPLKISLKEEENHELKEMFLRFWVSVGLTLPLVVIAMAHLFPGQPFKSLLMNNQGWMELLLATPVVLWGGWPFFVRGWQSVRNRSPNMFTLIALGTGVAFGYSLAAALFPTLFPEAFRDEHG
jgi:P-type Cu+ transporter